MSLRVYKNVLPKVAETAYVDESAQVIGDVEIGEDSSIWPLVSVRGDMHPIRIGRRTNIQDNSVLHVTHYGKFGEGVPLIIGDNVTVGHQVILHACTVEDEVLVGMGSVVMDKAILESGLILGAGSLVPQGKVLEGGYLWFGNPVKKIRPLRADEKDFLLYSAEHYVGVKNNYEEKNG
jgi:carbonic anhydrase/acetyltransferase-like protein (isoleucine patch superfamily)